MAFDALIAETIRKLREDKQLSQADLHRLTGLSRMLISRLEGAAGGRSLTRETARILAPVLGCEPDELMFPHLLEERRKGITRKPLVPKEFDEGSLPALVKSAAQKLASATTAAEILDARDMAALAYTTAKKTSRLARAKGAHDDLVAKAHRAQADALEIEAMAKRRLADEYDAAQDRGEVAGHGGGRNFKVGNKNVEPLASAADLGLNRKDIHEARVIRDAEAADPGVIRRTLDARLSEGVEPSKAALREVIASVARPDGGKPKSRKEAAGRRVFFQLVMACFDLQDIMDRGVEVDATLLDEDELEQVKRARATLNLVLKTAKG